MKLWAAVKDANRAIAPEESVAVRVTVFVAAMAAAIALASEGVAGSGVTAAAIVAIPTGFWMSYAFRDRDMLVLKLGLAFGLVVVVVDFFGSLGPVRTGDFVQVQVPLAELFLWVQILHSLHVPARRDLMFSLVASGVTFSIIAALTISLSMAPYLALWVVAAIASLVLAYRSSLSDAPGGASRPLLAGGQGTKVAPVVGRVVGWVVILGLAGFLVLPAANASRALAFPIGLGSGDRVGTPGGLSNPSLGDADPEHTQGDGASFDNRTSFGYFGFADQLDTALRGRPDDTLVMRVRAPAPAFWRAQSFDVWDGRRWTISDDSTRALGGAAPIDVPPTLGDSGFSGQEFVQTFYLETPGPNVVFGAHRPAEVYFPDALLYQLGDGTLRAGVQLGSDAVYTVVSLRQPATAELLRRADPVRFGVPDSIAEQYLQLPDVPQRVLDLAQEITRDAPTSYDKVRAIEAWMGENTTYTLDIPPLPDGVDATDHYLFMTRQGFCEQIGSSLVVMLRSLGIPARLTVGYTPGERNPFTGMYEVKASNAHSWTEVWFPGLGWQSFDPTAAVPLAGDFEGLNAGTGLFSWLSERLSPFAKYGKAVGALLAVAALVWVTVRIVGVRRALRRRTFYETMVARLEYLGEGVGRARHRAETIVEFAAALAGGPLADRRIVDLAGALTELGFSPGWRTSSSLKADLERTIEALIEAIERSHRKKRSSLAAARELLGV